MIHRRYLIPFKWNISTKIWEQNAYAAINNVPNYNANSVYDKRQTEKKKANVGSASCRGTGISAKQRADFVDDLFASKIARDRCNAIARKSRSKVAVAAKETEKYGISVRVGKLFVAAPASLLSTMLSSFVRITHALVDAENRLTV